MTNHQIKMKFLGMIEILEEFPPYKNWDESKMYRVYLEVDLNMEMED